MKPALPALLTAASVALCAAWAGVAHSEPAKPVAVHMPWKQAGLTEWQAAAHLLNRFAFGPRPGEVDAVVRMGLDRWLDRQIASDLPDAKALEDLRELPALAMSIDQIFKTYPPAGTILVQAKLAGILPDDIKRGDLKVKNQENDPERDELKAKLKAFAAEQGYRPEKELIGQLMTQKLVRAVESENQLEEVMTDFWFNHFNVSQTDPKVRPYLLSYERDAIRPQALGSFRGLLEATAKSPAMLAYLDNAQSTAAAGEPTTMQDEMDRTPRRRARFGGRGAAAADTDDDKDPAMARYNGQGMLAARQNRLARSPLAPKKKAQQGVNENYARELMELHTLGVDGGYSQQDVVEVARAFTGWGILPGQPKVRAAAETRLARAERAGGLGFRQEGDFLFRADQHDAAAKTILGVGFPAGRGIEDGEAVLDLLAANRATARHIASKLAVRFVTDHPSPALVDHLTGVYLKTGGDVRRLVAAIAESPEFWSRDAVGAKIKSPFELAASALRITGGDVIDPTALFQWINRMGQPLYAYQAPTGYPDRAEAWVNTGSLLNRMNFGLQLAANRVRGVSVDLTTLDGGREPASREEALRTYAALLMPGRDLDAALKLLGPMVADPNLAKRVDQAAAKDVKEPKPPIDRRPPSPLEQVVGVILGSPEFQRR